MKRFIPILFILGVLNSSLSAPQNPQQQQQRELRNGPISTHQAKILKQINKVNEDGSYTFGYEADDGSFKVETRSKDGVIKGKYGFIDPSGKLKTVEYSAGRRALSSPSAELRTSATETDSRAVKVKVRESRENSAGSDERPSNKDVNDSSQPTSSSEGSGEEDDPAFNSFSNPQPGQQEKDGGETSELTKRQGQLGTGPNDGQYPGGQGQRFQGAQQYIPTTQLQGGQFVDPRGQGGGFPQQGPQFYKGGAQPQYLSGGRPGQFPIGSFGLGGPQTPSHYVGRQYPQFGGGGGGFPLAPQTQQQQQQQGQDEDGFVAGLPPNFYQGGQQPRQQFANYNPQSQGLGFVRPGFQQQSPYQPQQFTSGGQGLVGLLGGQQGGRPQFNRFGVGNPQSFGQGQGQQQYVPNAELDGFSEDSDQDGFVDAYQGNNEGSKEEAADEKSPAVKSPGGGQYSPQVLGPQQVLQGQGRPGAFGSAGSPYTEQELQQLFAQQQGLGVGRPQAATYPQQFGRFPFQGQQFQQSPYLQQFSPQQFGGAGGSPYIQGGQGQLPYQGGQGAYLGGPQFSQYPVGGGQPQFLQGQLGQPQYSQGGPPQYLNIQGGVSPGAQQFPYDYVGGVGPNGFPLGGPQGPFPQQPQQQQLQQQQQQQLGQPQGSPPGPQAASPGASASVQAAASESKKDTNNNN